MAKRALVVGVSSYGFPNDLPSCARDAEAFGSMLETFYRFDHVRVLKDGEATRDGVDRGLERLFHDAEPNDRLVFFFSGTGCRFEKGGTIGEALVLQDGRLLNDHHLTERTENLPPGVFTAVLDCCFSGLRSSRACRAAPTSRTCPGSSSSRRWAGACSPTTSRRS